MCRTSFYSHHIPSGSVYLVQSRELKKTVQKMNRLEISVFSVMYEKSDISCSTESFQNVIELGNDLVVFKSAFQVTIGNTDGVVHN